MLSPETAKELKLQLIKYRDESIKLIDSPKSNLKHEDRFAHVLLDKNRYDLKVPLYDGDSNDDNKASSSQRQRVIQQSIKEIIIESPVGFVTQDIIGYVQSILRQ